MDISGPSVFFFSMGGDTRKVQNQALTSIEDLATVCKSKFPDSTTIQEEKTFEFFTKDSKYQVRHKVESLTDLYEGCVLEVQPLGGKTKRRLDQEGSGTEATPAGAGSPPKKRQKTEAGKERFVCRMRGLPWEATKQQLLDFFDGCDIVESQILYLPNGRATGEAVIELGSAEDHTKALGKNMDHIGHRYIEVFKATGEDMDRAMGRPVESEETGIPVNKNSFVVRMRGLPFSALEADVRDFFGQSNLTPVGIHVVREAITSRPSGIAFCEFATEAEASQALTLNRRTMGERYIEIFSSKVDDLCRAMGMPGYGEGWKANPDITGSCCVKMRGLPYACTEVDITKFYQEAGVTPTRIHRKADGAEAYVEFSTPDEADTAMQRNKQYIKHRYIELFRVSYNEVQRNVGLMEPAGITIPYYMQNQGMYGHPGPHMMGGPQVPAMPYYAQQGFRR